MPKANYVKVIENNCRAASCAAQIHGMFENDYRDFMRGVSSNRAAKWSRVEKSWAVWDRTAIELGVFPADPSHAWDNRRNAAHA